MGGCFSACKSDEKSYIEKGFAAYRQNKYHDAIAAFNDSISLDPQCDEAYIGQYLVFYKLGEVDDAVDKLRSAPNQENGLVKFYLAFNEKDKATAQAMYQQILDIDAQDITLNDKIAKALVLEARADLGKDQKLYDEAITICSEIPRDGAPSYWITELHYHKAKVFEKIGQYLEARQSALAACESHNGYIDAIILGARMLEKTMSETHLGYVISELDRAYNVNKDNIEALQVKSEVAYRNCKHDLSIGICNQIIALYPNFAEPYYRKGCNLMKLNKNPPITRPNYADAVVNYTKAIEYDPENVLYHLNRGAAEVCLGRMKDACEDFYEAYRLSGSESHLLKELLKLVEYDMRSFGLEVDGLDEYGNPSEFIKLKEEKRDLILQIVEEMDDRNILSRYISNPSDRIDGLLVFLKREQMSIINIVLIDYNAKLGSMDGVQKAYYEAFVTKLNQIYQKYYKQYHSGADHKVGSKQSYEHAANFLQLAPDEEIFAYLATDIAMKVTFAHKTLPTLSDGRQYESAESKIAHHDVCNLEKQICDGKISAYPSKDIADRVCTFVVSHDSGEIYEVPVAGEVDN